jgi:formylglycine-generating enzyme required for sulfatase activity
VLTSTGNKQEPYVTGSLGGGIVSIAGGALKPAPQRQSTEAERAWRLTKDTTSSAVLEAFIARFGDTYYGDLAKMRLAQLEVEIDAILADLKRRETEELTKQQVAMHKAEQDRKRAEEERKRVEADLLRPGRVFRDCPDVCPEMVVVPAGSFMMGSSPAEIAALVKQTHSASFHSEGPQHRVTIPRPFAVGKFEVTFAEWDACVAVGGCKHRPGDEGWARGKLPVIKVSWNDITQEYLPWLSRKTGKTYRLMTEAEWEYAARAGGTEARLDSLPRFSRTGAGRLSPTYPVASEPPNRWGLHDMTGNAFEWVSDWYAERGYATSALLDPQGPEAGHFRVVRGGPWILNVRFARLSARSWFVPTVRFGNIGVRCAREVAP